jgi:hypothetical protein
MLVPSTPVHENDQGVPSREGQAPQALGRVGRCGRPTPAACATTVAPAATPPMEGIFRRHRKLRRPAFVILGFLGFAPSDFEAQDKEASLW